MMIKVSTLVTAIAPCETRKQRQSETRFLTKIVRSSPQIQENQVSLIWGRACARNKQLV
ncbi:MAG: hypothetical protein MUE44_13165 [Oscillatoriaceae cyanobacterium Prado104]|nr:hypothetical protein [Oscillatoriaceae cyanobacterium Prado104]